MKSDQQLIESTRRQLGRSQPAAAMRYLAQEFHLGKTDLAWLAVDVYENIMTPEVQAIWHWDLAATGKGLTDEELNEALSHLHLRLS